jgi:hypothetical protein
MIWKIWKTSKLNIEKIWKKIPKRCDKYGRKASRIVKTFGKYGRKVS